MRENPATVFIAQKLAESFTTVPWRDLDADERATFLTIAINLVIDLYETGFTLPQPADPDAVWAQLQAAS